MEIKILVFEDDLFVAEEIGIHLKQEGYKNVVITTSKKEAFVKLEEDYPDLVILDIREAEDKEAGIDLAKYIKQKKAIPIIFLTAHPEDRSLTYGVVPDAFIEKPNYVNLIHAIDVAVNRFYQKESTANTEPIFLKEYLFINKKNVYYKVKKADIFYAYAKDQIITIITENDKFTLSSTLKRFDEQLDDPYFLKVYRSYFVNILHIDSFDSEQVSIANTPIPMSKSGHDLLLERIQKLKSK